MTAKRLNSEPFGEGQPEKRGRLAETNEEGLEAELDDEVEKELREFEELQSGLLGTTAERGNAGTENRHTVERGSVEQENAGGSDMEPDDLDQETEAKKKLQTLNKAPSRRPPTLDEVPSSSIRLLPDTFVEEDLRGDDLIDKSGISEDEEEACLDVEQLRLFKDLRASDPLLTPSSITPNCIKPHLESSVLEHSLAKQVEELTAQAHAISRSPEPYPDDCSNDPDFPSPGRRKSRSRARTKRSSQSSRSEPRKSPKKKHSTEQGSPTPKSSGMANKRALHGRALHLNGKSSESLMPKMTKAKRSPSSHQPSGSSMAEDSVQESVLLRNLQENGTSRIALAPPFEPIEAFVDPVLKIHAKSLDEDPTFRDPIFDDVSKPARQTKKTAADIPQIGKGEIHKRIERIKEKIVGGLRALHHGKAVDIDKTGSNPTIQQNPVIQRNNCRPKVVLAPVPLAKSPVKISTIEEDLRKSKSPGLSNLKPSTPACIDFLENSQNLANCGLCSEEQDKQEQALSTDRPDDSPQAIVPTISHDESEYCVIERIIHRRFTNGFSLDNEKLEMMGADRPTIQCSELHVYAKYYENHAWLVACNELQRFFCWPCLFFSSKMTWSMQCDENAETAVGKEMNKHAKSPAHQESIKQMDAFTLRNNASIIKTLLINKFTDGTWSEKDRETIILNGKPRPFLEGMSDGDLKEEKIAFKKFYDEVKWICGCPNTRKFYCWPCLLFSSGEWCCSGNIKSLATPISEHETEQRHMDACLRLGKREFDLRNESGVSKEENEDKTQSFVTNFVEILCAEKKKINNAELSSVDFLDTLELMSEYSGKLRVFIDGKSQSSKIAAAQVFATAIQDGVEFFIKGGILEEMRNSNFISLIFDHSSGVSNKAILSVIARYVDGNGHVHERFVKLLNVGFNTPSTTLVDEFFQVITELQCRSSLVGFTYDGYLVKPGDIPEFNERVQNLCPNAKFFHYTEHTFKRILKQTLCHLPVCRSALQKVKELASFFENNPAARKGLLDIVTAAEKSDNDGVWRSPNFITTVFLYHAVIVEIMESICKTPSVWNVNTVVQAASFIDFFRDPTNRFFVTLMARIFSTVEDLSNELKKDVTMEELKTIASHTALKLQKLGRNFDSVVDSACSHLVASDQENTRKAMSILREQCTNVVRLVVKLVKNRIFGVEAGYFKISKEAPKLNESNSVKLDGQYLVLHSTALPSNFNSEKLSKELQFLHKTSIAGHSFSEIIAHMINYNMVHVLPEVFKFLQLALTIPRTQYDTTNPAVRRMSAYVEGKKDVNSADALFWMEKEFLTNLQEDPNFYPKVTDRVMSITKKEILEKLS